MAKNLSTARVENTRPLGLEDRINRHAYIFIAPFFITFLIFSVYPVFRTLYLSFTNFKGYGEASFVGFDNYVRIFAKDKIFWNAVVNTLKLYGVGIVIQLGLALFLTIMFSDLKYRLKGLGVFRALFYLPNLIAATSVAFLFKTMLDFNYGSFNQILKSLNLITHNVDWLGTPATAQIATSIINAWMWFGTSFIMLMAGVQGINKDYFEAATIDGAGRWALFSKITMPLIRPIMLYVFVTSLIGGLQMFDIPFLISEGLGKPDRSLNTAVMQLYNMAFKNQQFGYAASIAYVLFAMIAIASIFSFRIMNKKEED